MDDKEKKSNKEIVIFIIIVCILLLGIILCIYKIEDYKKEVSDLKQLDTVNQVKEYNVMNNNAEENMINNSNNNIVGETSVEDSKSDTKKISSNKFNINDYIGFWEFYDTMPDTPEKELHIISIENNKIKFNYTIYRTYKYEDVTAYLNGDEAKFTAETNGANDKCEGSMKFDNNSITLTITNSEQDYVERGTSIFKIKNTSSELE